MFYAALHWKLNPMFGAAAMSLSSVCVVTNALRLRFFKADHKPVPAEPRAAAPAGEREVVLHISGMMCGHCTGRVTKALEDLGAQAEVTLEPGMARVKAPAAVSDKALQKAVEDAGYKVAALEHRDGKKER